MPVEHSLEELIQELHDYYFSPGSISLLKDKGFKKEEFQRLVEIMRQPDQTFEKRREKSWIEKALDRGDSEEITTGRYERYVEAFRDISSEQALVKGRMKFAVEYVINLADLLSDKGYHDLVKSPFTREEKTRLRIIYKDFNTKDFLAVKEIEKKTRHDIVAANTWVTIQAQRLGMDDNLMRGLVHLARTSSDVNTNVTGELYKKAIGQWTSAVVNLLYELHDRAKSRKYSKMTCVAETHGQDAQLTTIRHIYENLGKQIALHASPLLGKEILKLDGKIAGAIGTDVDMKAAFPELDPTPMYRDIVENVFGLRYVRYGNDQDCSNASLCKALDTMVNVGMVIKKAATDTWIYASRGILSKLTGKGESGSSVMPQKTNPFLAEGCEALTSIVNGVVNPIKEMIVSYREQGDLRRSITKREGFHPIMLSIIAIRRLIGELKKYEPDIIGIENEIYNAGPKIISSAINTYLRANGVPDAYDKIKSIVMKPYVRPDEITAYINGMVESKDISSEVADKVNRMLRSVMDTEGNMEKLRNSSPEKQRKLIDRLYKVNRNRERLKLVGDAVNNAYQMGYETKKTMDLLLRYSN